MNKKNTKILDVKSETFEEEVRRIGDNVLNKMVKKYRKQHQRNDNQNEI